MTNKIKCSLCNKHKRFDTYTYVEIGDDEPDLILCEWCHGQSMPIMIDGKPLCGGGNEYIGWY